MTNRDIANKFNRLAKIMELHNENPFKIKSYANAYNILRRVADDLSNKSKEELLEIEGIGKAIADKIIELVDTGELKTYVKYASITPPGLIELLEIKGLGGKKVRKLWKELSLESPGELQQAIYENRLLSLSGFGEKTQQNIKDKLSFYFKNRDQYLYVTLDEVEPQLIDVLTDAFPDDRFVYVGDFGMQRNVVKGFEILTTASTEEIGKCDFLDRVEGELRYHDFPVMIFEANQDSFDQKRIELTSSKEFIEALVSDSDDDVNVKYELAYKVPAFYRESALALEQCSDHSLPRFLELEDIKGIVHNHSTYSDGIHTLEEIAGYVKNRGYQYFAITDHSQAAFYANGLDENRVLEQWEEIDALNATYQDFKIIKGIECDILNDGSMDFSDNFLKTFELVIASIHSNLNMDEFKATNRLIKAIENPYVHILGHMTGRLLLSREGYPVNHMKIIDACAANGVAIEVNSNPSRLDMDWNWIPYALEKDVKLCINPDAHSKEAIHNIKYGVISARKGGLTADQCLNTYDTKQFIKWLEDR